MSKALELILALSILAAVVVSGDSLPLHAGGSLSLLILIPFFYFVGYKNNDHLTMSLMSLIVVIVVCVNYLDYANSNKLYSFSIIAILCCLLSGLFVMTFGKIMLNKYEYKINEIQNKQIVILKKNYDIIVVLCLVFSLLYAVFTCTAFWPDAKYNYPGENLAKFIPAAFVWIPVFLLLMFYIVKKVICSRIINSAEKNQAESLFNSDDIKAYLIMMVLIVLLGGPIEFVRENGSCG